MIYHGAKPTCETMVQNHGAKPTAGYTPELEKKMTKKRIQNDKKLISCTNNFVNIQNQKKFC
jgi:hypothetical protein